MLVKSIEYRGCVIRIYSNGDLTFSIIIELNKDKFVTEITPTTTSLKDALTLATFYIDNYLAAKSLP